MEKPREALDGEAFPTLTLTLGEQARAEAIRRGHEWRTHAALAVKWYGRRPCKGNDLRIVFDEVFRVNSSPRNMQCPFPTY
jgi:hypothetical protein